MNLKIRKKNELGGFSYEELKDVDVFVGLKDVDQNDIYTDDMVKMYQPGESEKDYILRSPEFSSIDGGFWLDSRPIGSVGLKSLCRFPPRQGSIYLKIVDRNHAPSTLPCLVY